MWTETPAASTRRCTSRPSAMVRATGFSQNTGRPASTAARMSDGWASVAAATTTPSTPAASNAAGVSAGSAPSRAATSAVTAETASVTTSESTTGRSVSVRAWNAPIRPNPMSPRRMVGSLLRSRSVHTADDVLVPVDDRPGDDAAAVRQQEHHEVGDLVDLAELAHRELLGRPLLPGVVGGMEGPLGGVLALGLGPADVEAVDADAVPAVGVGGVAGQAGQAGLGRHIGGQVGLAAQLGGGDDVDDGAGRPAGQHVPDGRLHQEE